MSFVSSLQERMGESPTFTLVNFAQPTGALPDNEFKEFLLLAQTAPVAGVPIFANWAKQKRAQGGVMAEVAIDRIISALDNIPPATVPGILASFAENLDEVALSSRDSDFGQARAWNSAEYATRLLLRRLPEAERSAVVRRLFKEGTALGWLTRLLRSEIFAHGHHGSRIQPEDQRLLTPDEFRDVLAIMLQRYGETAPDVLLRVPNLVSLLYAWQQGSGTDDARKWVQCITKTDDGLLVFLQRARGWIAKNDKAYYPLQRRDLKNFLDYDDAAQRVERISMDGNVSSNERRLANELLEALRLDSEDSL